MSACKHENTCRFHDPIEAAANAAYEEYCEAVAEPLHESELLHALEEWTGHQLSFSDAEEFSRILAAQNFRVVRLR